MILKLRGVTPSQFTAMDEWIRTEDNRVMARTPSALPTSLSSPYLLHLVSIADVREDGASVPVGSPTKNLHVTVRVEESYRHADGRQTKTPFTVLLKFLRLAGQFDLSMLAGFGSPIVGLALLQRRVEHVFDFKVYGYIRIRRAMSVLRIEYLGDLVQLEEQELLRIKNFGYKSLRIVKDELQKLDLTLYMTGPVVDEFKSWRVQTAVATV